MRLKASAITDKGMKRSQNQDSILSSTELGLFVVADGMGGHHGGEVASLLSTQSIENFFKTLDAGELTQDNESEVQAIAVNKVKAAIRIANSSIQNRGHDQPELAGMGTTTSVLFFPSAFNKKLNSRLAIAGQVGDSRIYYIHGGNIWQITKDHSLVQERLRAGLITRAQAKSDRNRNIITRSVGYESQVEADVFWIQSQPGDSFMICSDGLHGLVEDLEIKLIIEDHLRDGKNLDAATRTMIELANERGGDDNVSAVLIHIED